MSTDTANGRAAEYTENGADEHGSCLEGPLQAGSVFIHFLPCNPWYAVRGVSALTQTIPARLLERCRRPPRLD